MTPPRRGFFYHNFCYYRLVEFITKSAQETQKLAQFLAKEIYPPLVIGLEGELGSGKTTFIQGFAKGLGIKEKILSPTFVLMKKFGLPRSKAGHFYHIDCYRLNKPKDLLDLGFRKMLADNQGVIVIEWADKVKKILPQTNFLKIKFKYINEKTRKISFN